MWWWCGLGRLACGRVVVPATSRFGDGCDVVLVVGALVKEVVVVAVVAVGLLLPRHGLVVAACGGMVVVVDSDTSVVAVWVVWSLPPRHGVVVVGCGCSLPVVSSCIMQ